MGRGAKGSVYRSGGAVYLSVTLDKRRSFRLDGCSSDAEAEMRQSLIVPAAMDLKRAGQVELAVRFCQQAAAASEESLGKLLNLMVGVLKGEERVLPPVPQAPKSSSLTVREFAEKHWTNNEMARAYRRRVKHIDHTENIHRLKKHVYPVVFNGRPIGDTPLNDFTLDHADYVLAQPSLPERSVRHVAQCMHRLFKLAVYPARILAASPFPPGWLPSANPTKEGSYLYPSEDEAFLALIDVPLVKRLFIGFCAREGLRKTDAARIEWSSLSLDMPEGGGHIVLDRTKNGRGASWALDPGTAEALRRWRRICPSERWVFPAEALPRSRRSSHLGPLCVDHIAIDLRDGLKQAGVTREKLFEQNDNRMRLRAHDLRATFITLALANGRTEDWVRTRTGHGSSQMVARYRREAQTVQELKLGWLKPLHLAIPELAELGEPQLRVIMGG